MDASVPMLCANWILLSWVDKLGSYTHEHLAVVSRFLFSFLSSLFSGKVAWGIERKVKSEKRRVKSTKRKSRFRDFSFWCRWWDSNLTREIKKVLICKEIINSVLHFVLHNLFFVHKYLRKIGLQLVLYGGLFLCHDVSVHTVDHVLCFVTHIVCDVVFWDVEGEHH